MTISTAEYGTGTSGVEYALPKATVLERLPTVSLVTILSKHCAERIETQTFFQDQGPATR